MAKVKKTIIAGSLVKSVIYGWPLTTVSATIMAPVLFRASGTPLTVICISSIRTVIAMRTSDM